MQALRKGKVLWRMSWGDRRLFLTTFLLLLAIRVGLWLLPFRVLLKGLDRFSKVASRDADCCPVNSSVHVDQTDSRLTRFPSDASMRSNPVAAPQVSISQIIWGVNVSTRYMPGGAKCLARALTAKVMLNGQGYDPHLRIGVAKSPAGQLEAHAWLEDQGKVLIGNLPDLPRYVTLPSLEGVQR
ncbi:MAG: lasso peptide biosynthesis B2 protein [Oculatellaceae cyanobacterium Prado106]|jgi:hypothetical protein|nr:lasso peptide biosynthesis B2 protein [Oculatellaceae cyanobacterium Prado106]